jgi:hypothetical protein
MLKHFWVLFFATNFVYSSTAHSNHVTQPPGVGTTVFVTEAVISPATLQDGSQGVLLGFDVINNTSSYIKAFAVGNDTAEQSLNFFTADGEWSNYGGGLNVVLTRPNTSSSWTYQFGDPGEISSGPVTWLTASDLPGYTRGFLFETTFGYIPPGSSLSSGNLYNLGVPLPPGTDYRVGGTAVSAASEFAVLGVNIDLNTGTESGGTVFGGHTTNINAVPLPAALYLFISGLAGFGLIQRRN